MDTRMIKVSQIPTDASEDSLRFFFENTKRTGGGDIEELDYNPRAHTAIITFEDDGVVQRILGKTPLLFHSKKINIDSYFPPKQGNLDGKYNQDSDNEDTDFHAIKVSDFDEKATSKDTLLYYFESRKGANADVLSIEPGEDGETSYILRFENEIDVQTVLEKSHRLGNRLLKVEKYLPPPPIPNYPEKALITNISGLTSEESLQNFLEGRAKLEISRIENGESEGVALVTFADEIDIPNLQLQCKKRSLEGSYLEVSSVPMTKCVIVTNFKEGTSADTLEFYFDNRKRSGVDGVEKTKMEDEQGQCLINFEDYEAAIRVCERKHMVEGSELNVRLYHESLGRQNDETDNFECPRPFEVKGIDELKLKFIRK